MSMESHMNAVHVNFVAMLIAVAAYVVVSLLTCRKPHNMDQLLHRGQYAAEPEAARSSSRRGVLSFPESLALTKNSPVVTGG